MNKIENDNLAKLIIDAQNDVDGAFEKLYKETIEFSYGRASLLLKNKEDIEDALQNSYMYVAKSIGDLKNPESFESWLSVIVKHECQKYIAKRKRVTDIFSAVLKSKDFELPVEESLPFDLIERKEINVAVQKIVNSLPDDKRACVVLYYFEQNSLSEIAEILGIPEGTVKSRLYNARKTLEKEFKKLQKKDNTLLGISVIPLVAAFFAYQAENIAIPAVISEGAAVCAAATAVGSISSSASAATTAAGGTTAVAGTSAVSAAGTASAAIATKITAVAVAATVATGGGIATVNYVNHKNESATTETVSVSVIESYTTASAIISEENTLTLTDVSTAPVSDILNSTEKNTLLTTVSASVPETEKQTTTKKHITEKTTVRETTTAKQITTTQPTTVKNTTTQTVTVTEITELSTTEKNTTAQSVTVTETTEQSTTEKNTIATQPETTEETTQTTTSKAVTTVVQTTDLADIYSVSNGVLGKYTGSDSDVAIPSSVGSGEVTAIGSGAFAGNAEIAYVSVPSTVTRIGQEAFVDCVNLKSISLPSSLQSIGLGAFCSCTGLTSVNIPSGVTTIGDDAFADCTSLESITIPSSVTSIGDNAFGGCDNLTIKCSEGSAAYNYAVENSMNYELI